MQRFEGKVAIVTGGASGIGEATVRRLHSEGATVVIADIRPEAIDALKSELGEERAFGFEIDMFDTRAVEEMIDAVVQQHGRLDLLVNNAGMGSFGRADQTTLEQWREVMALDLDAVFVASKAALPQLAKNSGSIVNVASISGMLGDHSFVAYNSAKAAVLNLTRCMAIDHAPDVRVNAISPGLTATPLAVGLTENREIMDAYELGLKMGRPAFPSEIAAAIAFLGSDDASFVNGHNLVVDGGTTAHTGQPNFTKLLAGESHLDKADTQIKR